MDQERSPVDGRDYQPYAKIRYDRTGTDWMIANEPKRLTLANLPTPLVRLDRLASELGGVDLWMKRDDLTGLETTGNKIRKLEYILADALENGATAIVTEGACQSNHCRATAALCAKLGLHCTLLFRPPSPPETQGNHLLDVLFGAEIREYEAEAFKADHDAIIDQVLDDLRSLGHTPRYTPMGASEPLGCWGYIRGMFEMIVQLDDVSIDECDIVVAVSSGATYAGLIMGHLLADRPKMRVWAVPVSDNEPFHRQSVLRQCQAATKQFRLPIDVHDSDFRFIDGYVGHGYAVPYDEAIRTIKLLSHTEAILLDPVYTGKAFTAFLDRIRDGKLGRHCPAIFLHTGGIFSDFAWPKMLIEGVSTNLPR